jgi:hypothetical protein
VPSSPTRKPIDQLALDMGGWVRQLVAAYYRIGCFGNDPARIINQQSADGESSLFACFFRQCHGARRGVLCIPNSASSGTNAWSQV